MLIFVLYLEQIFTFVYAYDIILVLSRDILDLLIKILGLLGLTPLEYKYGFYLDSILCIRFF